MFGQLEELVQKFEIIGEQISNPDVIANQERWQKLMKEHSDLGPIVEKYKEYTGVLEAIDEALMMLEEPLDNDFKEMVKEELAENKKRVEPLENELKLLLIPKDPNDDKNVIVEIRGGAGGDEAALFAADLYRMYCYYAESQRWKTELMDLNENGLGGFKEVIFMIKGQGAYSKLKYESGVHRVQRIPTTESGGRIHTSTVTVAVLPEAEEVDVELNMGDIRVDVFRSSGNGGQSVNTTDSAVRITHMPTGIVVQCQNERSQIQNREKAMQMLKAKLFEKEREEQMATLDSIRGEKKEIGWGSQIRSYVFHPYNMVKDHRTSEETGNTGAVMDGEIDRFINAYLVWIHQRD